MKNSFVVHIKECFSVSNFLIKLLCVHLQYCITFCHPPLISSDKLHPNIVHSLMSDTLYKSKNGLAKRGALYNVRRIHLTNIYL